MVKKNLSAHVLSLKDFLSKQVLPVSDTLLFLANDQVSHFLMQLLMLC
jgi:hypothetical protein